MSRDFMLGIIRRLVEMISECRIQLIRVTTDANQSDNNRPL